MTALRSHLRLRALSWIVVALGTLGGDAASAQTATGVPNALQGFSQNRDKPIKIDAESLEVRQRDSAGKI
ncbi:MAG TPA: hypothetical protein VGQ93_07755, partial [Lysobacter sp.]|nr:hypothetical protein [Lysobacter sp.]